MEVFQKKANQRYSSPAARLHEIKGVAVEDCRVSEGISQPPRLQSDRGIDLHHFHHLCAGVSQAAKAHVGDRQEQVGITVFGLRQSIRGLSESPQYQIRPTPTVIVAPTQCRIPRRSLVSPLKRLFRSPICTSTIIKRESMNVS